MPEVPAAVPILPEIPKHLSTAPPPIESIHTVKREQTDIAEETSQHIDQAAARKFFDHLGKHFSFQQPDDWYKLRKEDVYLHEGQSLLQKCYHDSVFLVFRGL